MHRRSGTSYETVGGNLETNEATAEIMITGIEPGFEYIGKTKASYFYFNNFTN